MKLEAGKLYACRNRPDIKYVRVDAVRPESCLEGERVAVTRFSKDALDNTIESFFWDEDTELWITTDWYYINGRHCALERTPEDLIAEYSDQPYDIDLDKAVIKWVSDHLKHIRHELKKHLEDEVKKSRAEGLTNIINNEGMEEK